jgi:ParB-like chromosome segregation protein Spo0J
MAQLVTIALATIDPTPDNRETSAERTAGLADSIAAVGLASPLEVFETPTGRYRLSGGHHRRAALERLGRADAPCYVVDPPKGDAEQVRRRLASNAARVELSCQDAYRELAELAAAGTTVDEMATVCGHSTDWVRRRLVLGDLDPSVRYIADARGPRFAEVLAGIPQDLQRELVRLLEDRDPPLERWREMVAESRRRRAELDAQGLFDGSTFELVAETWSTVDARYTDDAPESPYTPVNGPSAPPVPLGVADVAERLGVRPATVVAWRRRPAVRFPVPDMTVSGAPAWWPWTIDRWASVPRRPGRPTK